MNSSLVEILNSPGYRCSKGYFPERVEGLSFGFVGLYSWNVTQLKNHWRLDML
jgi:hypothetical protein